MTDEHYSRGLWRYNAVKQFKSQKRKFMVLLHF